MAEEVGLQSTTKHVEPPPEEFDSTIDQISLKDREKILRKL